MTGKRSCSSGVAGSTATFVTPPQVFPVVTKKSLRNTSRSMNLLRLLVPLLVVSMPDSLKAQEVALGGRPILEVGQQLKPGEYVWAPELSAEGPALAIVNLATQRLALFRGGVPIGASTVSSGSVGHETPTGVFTIL